LFAEHSYGFRPGRGCKDALRRVYDLIEEGYWFTVDIDLKAYFDTIPHDKLLDLVRKHVADGRLLDLIEAYLKAPILEEMNTWTPEQGAPQGAVLSPLLSNLYLNDLDHLMAQRGYEMTRYADDMVIQCRTAQEAERALAEVRAWTEAQGLTLHPTKTKVVDERNECRVPRFMDVASHVDRDSTSEPHVHERGRPATVRSRWPCVSLARG